MAFKETEIEVLTAIQAEVMEKLAVNELVDRVVLLVRWEQFTYDSSFDVIKCSQVKRET